MKRLKVYERTFLFYNLHDNFRNISHIDKIIGIYQERERERKRFILYNKIVYKIITYIYIVANMR